MQKKQTLRYFQILMVHLKNKIIFPLSLSSIFHKSGEQTFSDMFLIKLISRYWLGPLLNTRVHYQSASH